MQSTGGGGGNNLPVSPAGAIAHFGPWSYYRSCCYEVASRGTSHACRPVSWRRPVAHGGTSRPLSTCGFCRAASGKLQGLLWFQRTSPAKLLRRPRRSDAGAQATKSLSVVSLDSRRHRRTPALETSPDQAEVGGVVIVDVAAAVSSINDRSESQVTVGEVL